MFIRGRACCQANLSVACPTFRHRKPRSGFWNHLDGSIYWEWPNFCSHWGFWWSGRSPSHPSLAIADHFSLLVYLPFPVKNWYQHSCASNHKLVRSGCFDHQQHMLPGNPWCHFQLSTESSATASSFDNRHFRGSHGRCVPLQ
jgi:hypothetical protein